MDDAQWIFLQESREKKNVAHSAQHKRNGSKSTSCRLPSDLMTKKERDAMNGAVKTYNIEHLVTYEEFKQMPNDIKKQYLLNLLDGKHGFVTEIAEKMGVCRVTMYNQMKRLGIDRSGIYYRTKEDEAVWKKFVADETGEAREEIKEPVEEEKVDTSLCMAVEEAKTVVVAAPKTTAMKRANFEFDGVTKDALKDIMQLISVVMPENCKIKIEIEEDAK